MALNLWRAGSGIGAMLAAASVLAATPRASLPEPGLYRIDAVNQLEMDAGRARLAEDGATGTVTARTQSGGYDSGDRVYPGNGPQQRCIPATPAFPPPGIGAPCTNTATHGSPGSFIHTAQCGPVQVKVTGKQLDKDTWDIVQEHVMTPAPGAPDLSGMRPLLERMAQHAPTAEERAKAAAQLAQLPAMQADMSAKRAQVHADFEKAKSSAKTPEEAAMLAAAQARLQTSGMPMTATRHERWTKISSSCLGGAAPR
ncbi:hypothetical protein GJ700_20470 [Duganella sp. FT92W]|uniref:DUF3617 family protein n=1 Tax=Pseudoduganella rivuli TaxID=2666085 RepID=A0A7X2LVI3_9BURK|nr:hypothetical protein [Pseudoduganella rivuli]MRV74087.1 hypothetical protein [Pseudoduganella rivuli]